MYFLKWLDLVSLLNHHFCPVEEEHRFWDEVIIKSIGINASVCTLLLWCCSNKCFIWSCTRTSSNAFQTQSCSQQAYIFTLPREKKKKMERKRKLVTSLTRGNGDKLLLGSLSEWIKLMHVMKPLYMISYNYSPAFPYLCIDIRQDYAYIQFLIFEVYAYIQFLIFD